jgi:adiponectin receptor
MSGSELKRRLVPTADTDHTASERTHEMPASKTVTWDEIPDWQRDNRFILRGYRSATPKFRDILTSLTFMHNETCNVYTHLTGAVVLPFLAIPCWQYLSESRFSHVTGQDYTMFALFFCAAEICLVISTLYHLQMSHSHETEQFWLRMDLIGIIIAIEGTHISGINYIFPCEPKWQAVHWSTVSNSHAAHLGFRRLISDKDHSLRPRNRSHGRRTALRWLASRTNHCLYRTRRHFVHSTRTRCGTVRL